MIQIAKIEYIDGDTVLEGYCALDDTKPGKKPAVIVAHDWSGRNDFACQKAEKLAELGYVGFALDMYGRRIIGKTNEEKSALIKPFMEDRALLRRRILAALATVQELEVVNTASIAVMGFCFGGLCALDLARSGADIRGAVSFHGLLNAPTGIPQEKIVAKVLALHGHDDPMVPPAQVADFQKEMTDAKVDWQFHTFGNVMHGFTNPVAHDPKFGTVYDGLADKRSWVIAREFFAEIFAS
ncbi:MAG: dienelactone hydrolase family protein [Gammaproteobacteria bacterium]|nr:dienelactone hydrolase family protein [Gammaproteobacteria bacterium]